MCSCKLVGILSPRPPQGLCTMQAIWLSVRCSIQGLAVLHSISASCEHCCPACYGEPLVLQQCVAPPELGSHWASAEAGCALWHTAAAACRSQLMLRTHRTLHRESERLHKGSLHSKLVFASMLAGTHDQCTQWQASRTCLQALSGSMPC
jgi:hypothetical protein